MCKLSKQTSPRIVLSVWLLLMIICIRVRVVLSSARHGTVGEAEAAGVCVPDTGGWAVWWGCLPHGCTPLPGTLDRGSRLVRQSTHPALFLVSATHKKWKGLGDYALILGMSEGPQGCPCRTNPKNVREKWWMKLYYVVPKPVSSCFRP